MLSGSVEAEAPGDEGLVSDDSEEAVSEAGDLPVADNVTI